MLENLPVGSRAPIYVPSSDAVAVVVDTTSRADERDAPPPPRPPLPAGELGARMPRVSPWKSCPHLMHFHRPEECTNAHLFFLNREPAAMEPIYLTVRVPF